jgi:uncharacterized protein YxeA
MTILLITILIILCVIFYTKDYFTIDTNQMISEKEYTHQFTEDGREYKVKSYTYKITFKNKRIKYKTFNIIEDGR